LPQISISGISFKSVANYLAASIIFLDYSAYFFLPVVYITYQAPLTATPDLDPHIEGTA